jgi:hypothetical protein
MSIIKRYLFGAVAETSRKAPAFLQGLLQFELRLVGGGGLEPPTPCFNSFSLSQVVSEGLYTSFGVNSFSEKLTLFF